MTLPRNAPNDQTNIENLHQLHLYKLHNSAVGEANQSLDDYVDVADEYFTQICMMGEDRIVGDVPKSITGGAERL